MSINIINVIKLDNTNNYLIEKSPIEDFNIGSQLIVHESQQAVFFYDGQALESFGSGRYTLSTENYPFLKGLIRSISGGTNSFHAEVYFINLITQLGVKWGTDSKVRLFDPASGLHIELGASGTFNLRIIDGRRLLLKVVGVSKTLSPEMIFGDKSNPIGLFKGMIVSKVKSFLPQIIKNNGINILEIDEHIEQISKLLQSEINRDFEKYGLEISEFYVTAISTPDDDPNYRRMREQYAEKYLKIQQQKIEEAEAIAALSAVKAKGEVEIARAKAKAYAEAEAIKIKTEAEASRERALGAAHGEALRAQGADYNKETIRKIGIAGAEGGSSNSGILNEVVRAGLGVGIGVQIVKTIATAFGDILVNSDGSWECPRCHSKNNKGRYCSECGLENPDLSEKWDCSNCGTKGLTSKFCPNCGYRKQEK